MTSASRGLALAVLATFATALLAISEHSRAVEQGYRLAAARREGEVLAREAIRAERRAAALAVPAAVQQRAAAMKLGLEHPRDRRILSYEEAARLAAPPAPAMAAPVPPSAPVPAALRATVPARVPAGEVMPR